MCQQPLIMLKMTVHQQHKETKMENLLKEGKYPQELRQTIYSKSSLGVAIANRWMLGWPKTVEELIASNQYQAAFLEQEETERKTLAELSQNWSHLAQHEKMQMMEINPAPPMTS